MTMLYIETKKLNANLILLKAAKIFLYYELSGSIRYFIYK